MLAVSATAASIAIVAGIALELQIGKRTNSFLDRANQEIFMPRGQYAMIMRFTDRPLKKAQKGENTGNAHFGDPEADRLGGLFSMEQINFNQSGERSEDGSSISQHQRLEFDAAATISKFTYSAEHPQMNSWQKRLKDYRKASGTTVNDAHLPQCAPLVFPEIDRAAIRARDGLEPKSSFQSGATWVRDYIDRKEQESFVSTYHSGFQSDKDSPLIEDRKPITKALRLLSLNQNGRPSSHVSMTQTTRQVVVNFCRFSAAVIIIPNQVYLSALGPPSKNHRIKNGLPKACLRVKLSSRL